MQLFSHVHQLHQRLETVQKRGYLTGQLLQLRYPINYSKRTRCGLIHISATYIVIIPSQVFLIIWYLITVRYMSWEGSLRLELGQREEAGFHQSCLSLNPAFFCFCTWCKALGYALCFPESRIFIDVFFTIAGWGL